VLPFFDPFNRKLCVGEQFPDPLHIRSFWEAIRIDPETGAGKVVALPFDCEDMAFDSDSWRPTRRSPLQYRKMSADNHRKREVYQNE
jgi:hypothetical protein